jgi:hypothetical protein
MRSYPPGSCPPQARPESMRTPNPPHAESLQQPGAGVAHSTINSRRLAPAEAVSALPVSRRSWKWTSGRPLERVQAATRGGGSYSGGAVPIRQRRCTGPDGRPPSRTCRRCSPKAPDGIGRIRHLPGLTLSPRVSSAWPLRPIGRAPARVLTSLTDNGPVPPQVPDSAGSSPSVAKTSQADSAD